MNTPFYRQKLMQRFGETLELESFTRQQVKEWYVRDLKSLWEEHRADLKVLHHVSEEREVRERLFIAEKKSRHTLRTACRRDEIALALVMHEREERELVEQKWVRTGAALRDMHIDVMMVLSLQDKEFWTRRRLLEMEATAYSCLMSLNEECQSCLNNFTRARRLLIESCLSGRDDIVLARLDKMESLAGSFRQGEQLIAEWYRERHELALEAERSARDVAADQDVNRRRLREMMAAAYEETLELEKMLVEECLEVARCEAKERASLEADEAHGSHIIFLQQQKSMEEALELMEMKKAARGEFEQQTLWHIRHIVDEEDESFSHLLAWGREHAERTHQRIISNRRAREQLAERFREWAGMLWDVRVDELKGLRQQMLIEADEVARCVEERRQVLKCFAADAVKELSRLAVQELDARAELLARREQEAEDVAAFTAYKSSERNGVAISEVDRRLKVEELEATARYAIVSLRSDALEATRRRRLEFASQCKLLERTIMHDRYSIEDDQDAAFAAILRSLEDALFMTFADEQARERQRFESYESRCRNDGMLTEIRLRDQIRLQMAGERRTFERRTQAIWEAYIQEVVVREDGDRQLVERLWAEEMEHMRLDYVREGYESEDLVAARLKIELLRRQEYMREEPRLLDPFEQPMEEAEMSIAEFRKSVQINSPHRPSAHSAVHCQLEFVQTALGCSDLRHLSMGLVGFLSEMIDASNESTLGAKDAVTRMKRENEALKKSLDRLHATEQAAREQIDFYTKKLERDAKAHKDRREMEKRERAKEEARLKAEEKRCSEKQAAAKDMAELNERLKDSIRMQHSSRR